MDTKKISESITKLGREEFVNKLKKIITSLNPNWNLFISNYNQDIYFTTSWDFSNPLPNIEIIMLMNKNNNYFIKVDFHDVIDHRLPGVGYEKCGHQPPQYKKSISQVSEIINSLEELAEKFYKK